MKNPFDNILSIGFAMLVVFGFLFTIQITESQLTETRSWTKTLACTGYSKGYAQALADIQAGHLTFEQSYLKFSQSIDSILNIPPATPRGSQAKLRW